MSKPTAEKQPLINQKATLRMAVGLLIIAGLIFAYQWYQKKATDVFGGGTEVTAGWIGAVELGDRGSQVVLLKPDGKIERSLDYKPGSREPEFTWRPDGNQIFLSSDRDGKALNIFRWNLAMDNVEQKTHGRMARSRPSFFPENEADQSWPVMMVSGGSVWSLDPKELQAEMVMPFGGSDPVSTADQEGKEGGEGAADASAGRYRIRKAMWGKDQAWIIAVRRIEEDENSLDALVIQSMTGDEKKRKLIPIMFADRIDFDVNYKTGDVVYTAQVFRWPDSKQPPPQVIKNGIAAKPFLHAVGIFNPNDASTWSIGIPQDPKDLPKAFPTVHTSDSNDLAFANPRISPDGKSIAVIKGRYEEGTVVPKSLAVMAAAMNSKPLDVVPGEVYEPSWHPNSTTIVFIRRENGKRNIYTISQGEPEKRVSDGLKSYANPQFSPQSK